MRAELVEMARCAAVTDSVSVDVVSAPLSVPLRLLASATADICANATTTLASTTTENYVEVCWLLLAVAHY